MKEKKSKLFNRLLVYGIAMVILALGLTLNSKTDLGMAPIISIAYTTSVWNGMNFGDMTFLLYSIFVIIEIAIHISLKWYTTIPKDLLQIVMSLFFTRFINLFNYFIPAFKEDLAGTVWAGLPVRLLMLCLAVILTGIGASMMMDVRLILTPGDGITQSVSDRTGKPVGYTKNCVDLTCFLINAAISCGLIGRFVGIGIGTIVAMLGVGRVIAVFNHFTQKPIERFIGLA